MAGRRPQRRCSKNRKRTYKELSDESSDDDSDAKEDRQSKSALATNEPDQSTHINDATPLPPLPPKPSRYIDIFGLLKRYGRNCLAYRRPPSPLSHLAQSPSNAEAEATNQKAATSTSASTVVTHELQVRLDRDFVRRYMQGVANMPEQPGRISRDTIRRNTIGAIGATAADARPPSSHATPKKRRVEFVTADNYKDHIPASDSDSSDDDLPTNSIDNSIEESQVQRSSETSLPIRVGTDTNKLTQSQRITRSMSGTHTVQFRSNFYCTSNTFCLQRHSIFLVSVQLTVKLYRM